ncbi:MAG: BrnT family toxin [Betaproteobacteria bacterium]
MRFEFDPHKDLLNLHKHGVSLALASELDWDAALLWVDNRRDCGEMRILALAPRTAILYYVAFVDRDGVRRVISLRRANRREVRRYVQVFEDDTDPDA